MQFNLQSETCGGGSTELTNNSSDDSQMIVAFRKFPPHERMTKQELEAMVFDKVQQEVEDLIGKVEKEVSFCSPENISPRSQAEIVVQSAIKKLLTGWARNYADEIDMPPRERVLQFKFLDEVSSVVLTGKAIKAEGGTAIRVALNDETGHVVDNGPESSGKVEILVVEASTDENESNLSLEEFSNRITRVTDKKRPHFTKSQYVGLKKGVGTLSDVKLGNHKSWTKNCRCRLWVRTVGNFHGVKVKEAWSGPFTVKDSRCSHSKKRYPPVLLDDLWKLENIRKKGPRHKSLKEAMVFTVKDFLFLLHVDPKQLEEKAKVHGSEWSAIVNHAQTCVIDDKKIYVYCLPSSESKTGVAFDVVGRVKGIIQDSHYVPATNPRQADKALQHNLLMSAFKNRDDITSFNDEASLLHQFPYPSSEIADRNDPSLGGDPRISDLPIFRSTTNVHDPTEPERIDSFRGQSDTREDPNQGEVEEPLPTSDHVNALESPNPNYLPDVHDKYIGTSLNAVEAFLLDDEYNDAEVHQNQLDYHVYILNNEIVARNYLVRASVVILWVLRVRKRVTGQGDNHRVFKRTKIVTVTDCCF